MKKISLDGIDGSGMYCTADVAHHALQQQLHPHNLDAASGGARAGPDEHQRHQQHPAQLRPQIKIGSGIPRRGHDG